MEMVKNAAKVFGYVDKSLKERVAKLREKNGRLTESRLVDEGLNQRVEYYESQLREEKPARKTPSTGFQREMAK